MIIVAFADKTSKQLPRIICRKIKHVAPISVHNDKIIMYQFTHSKNIRPIVLQMRDLQILQKYGWRYVYINGTLRNNFAKQKAKTCVGFTKNAIGVHNWKIQTPYALYKYLMRL